MKTLLLLFFVSTISLHAQHTLQWQENTTSPAATLADVDWISFFDGLTFEKVHDNELNIHVLFENSGKEATFNYKRVK